MRFKEPKNAFEEKREIFANARADVDEFTRNKRLDFHHKKKLL